MPRTVFLRQRQLSH